MLQMPDIGCQRGHADHATRTVHVDLARRHTYYDLPAVPAHLARAFDFEVYDPARYPIDDADYCPAHDAVSHTIADCGIWEPCETIMTLQVCSTKPERVLDFGAHIGWFSKLASLTGCETHAFEADPTNIGVLRRNCPDAVVHGGRIDGKTRTLPRWNIRLAKMDLEGAEADAVRMIWPSIALGRVDHVLLEVTPSFSPTYPDLMAQLMGKGFEAYLLPDKATPALPLVDPARDLIALSEGDVRAGVARWHQAMVWFRHEGAPW